MTERRAYRITGRVQGVGFRWWAREVARSLELQGTVRNAPDGTVRIDAAGPRESLEQFERRLREGPTAARVQEVATEMPGSGALPSRFEIGP